MISIYKKKKNWFALKTIFIMVVPLVTSVSCEKISIIKKDSIKNSITTVKKVINGWKKGSLTAHNSIKAVDLSSEVRFDANALQVLAGNSLTFPSSIKGTTLSYHHQKQTEDGNLEVTVVIKKGTMQDTAMFNVFVSGLNKNWVRKKIQGLTTNVFDSLVVRDIFPSTITQNQVFAVLTKMQVISNLTNSQKALLKASDIALDANDYRGKLTITINNHGPNKVFNLNGFHSGIKILRAKVKAAIQAISIDDMRLWINPSILPSAFDKTSVYRILRTLAADYADLNVYDVARVLHQRNIALTANDATGTLTIRLSNYGPVKVFVLNGFKVKRNL